MIPRTVDRIQMIIMAVGLALLGIDILPERSVQVGRLKVVRGERISGKQRMHITVCNKQGKRVSGVMVKSKRGSHDPNDLPMLPFVAQQLI